MLIVSRSRMTEKSVVARRRPSLTSFATCAPGTSLYVGFALIQGVDFRCLDVEAGHAKAGVPKLHGERQPHISEAHDAHARRPSADLPGQLLQVGRRAGFNDGGSGFHINSAYLWNSISVHGEVPHISPLVPPVF